MLYRCITSKERACCSYYWSLFAPCLSSSFPLQLRTCSRGSRPQRATTTPTSCTPWRTQGRPSSMIISPPSRCRLSHGPTSPGACRHGNSNRQLCLTLPEREVLYSGGWLSVCPSLTGGRWGDSKQTVLVNQWLPFSRHPEANDPHKLPHIDLEFYLIYYS